MHFFHQRRYYGYFEVKNNWWKNEWNIFVSKNASKSDAKGSWPIKCQYVTSWEWERVVQTESFCLHTMLNDGLAGGWIMWCFYQQFGLSFWRHPFTVEDPLVSKWSSKSVLMKKQTHPHLGWPEDEKIPWTILKMLLHGELEHSFVEFSKEAWIVVGGHW